MSNHHVCDWTLKNLTLLTFFVTPFGLDKMCLVTFCITEGFFHGECQHNCVAPTETILCSFHNLFNPNSLV